MKRRADLARAVEFLWRHARVLERRVFACRFLGEDPRQVVDAVRAYRNADGGFGQALEPDLRGCESQPVHVDFALSTLREQPSLNFTLALAGQLHWQGAGHRWLARATDTCWDWLAGREMRDAHALRSAFVFLECFAGEPRTRELAARLAEQLPASEYFVGEVPVTRYGRTPLGFAPRPGAAPWPAFPDGVIESHLDDLAARQQGDGGWPIFWEAPGEVARVEWRARWTLDALCALRNHGRLASAARGSGAPRGEA
jgi:hypothetical protein